jgi:hypothetical protein
MIAEPFTPRRSRKTRLEIGKNKSLDPARFTR